MMDDGGAAVWFRRCAFVVFVDHQHPHCPHLVGSR